MGFFNWVGETFGIKELRDPEPPKPPVVATPTYADTLKSNLAGQIDVAQPLFDVEAKMQPQYARLQSDIQDIQAEAQIQQARKIYPQVAEIENAYQALNKSYDIGRLSSYLPGYQQALSAITPGYQEGVNLMGQLARQAGASALRAPVVENYLSQIQGPQASGIVSAAPSYQPATRDIYRSSRPREAGYLRGVSGPELSSGLENIDRDVVEQYVSAIPGAAQAAASAGNLLQKELALGRSLSPEDERIAQQTARAAYAARGTVLGPQAVASELLNREQLANARMQQRLATAGSLQNLIQQNYAPALAQSLSRQLSGSQYGLSSQAQLFAQQQARENLAQDLQRQRFAQTLGREEFLKAAQEQNFRQALSREGFGQDIQQKQFTQALQRQQADLSRLSGEVGVQAQQAQLSAGALGQMLAAQGPAIQAFYGQPILQGTANFAQQMALNAQQQTGPQLFSPESSAGFGATYTDYMQRAGLGAMQYQTDAGKYAAQQRASQQLRQDIGSGIGSLAAVLAYCWVAREVYGEHNPKWKVFRSWMFACAPDWLFSLYGKYGERVAQYIKDKPLLKAIIRRWMDSKINVITIN